MFVAIVVILLIVVIIFGVSSTMQSYASAQQAQAVIEVAQVAQVNAWGNVVTLLILAAVILVLLVAAVGVLWVMWKRATLSAAPTKASPAVRHITEPSGMDPEKALSLMVQMKMLEMLDTRKAPPSQLEAPKEGPVELFHWLK